MVTRSERQNLNTSDDDEGETPTTGNDHQGTSTGGLTGPPRAHQQQSTRTTQPPLMRAASKGAQKNIVSTKKLITILRKKFKILFMKGVNKSTFHPPPLPTLTYQHCKHYQQHHWVLSKVTRA